MADLTSIIEHLDKAVNPLERLVSGFCYLLGFLFVWGGLKKLRVIADSRAQSGGGKSVFVPLMYLLGGSCLLFLPTMYSVATNTLWGSGSPLAYTAWAEQFLAKYGASNMSVTHILQFIGILWFVRGIVLLVQSTEPGNQHGTKGLLFLIAGICAMNIQYTYQLISDALDHIINNWFK